MLCRTFKVRITWLKCSFLTTVSTEKPKMTKVLYLKIGSVRICLNALAYSQICI